MFSRVFALAATFIAAGLLVTSPACPSELGDQLLKDFRAQLTESQLEQLEKEGFVEEPISDVPEEMVERAVELSHDLFWVAINHQKSQPEPSTVTAGTLGIRKSLRDAEDPTPVEVLEVKLTWHDPEFDGPFTATGLYMPEPLSSGLEAPQSDVAVVSGPLTELVKAFKGFLLSLCERPD